VCEQLQFATKSYCVALEIERAFEVRGPRRERNLVGEQSVDRESGSGSRSDPNQQESELVRPAESVCRSALSDPEA
jgi:hypothetical protein